MVKIILLVCLATTIAEDQKSDSLSKFLDAAAFGDLKTISSLLEKGEVQVNQRNKYGESALHLASIQSKPDIVDFLLKAGADPSAYTEGRYEGHPTVVQRTVLMWFIGHKCHEASIELLIKAGANVNFVNEDGNTAFDLVKASSQCTEQVVSLMLAAGALRATKLPKPEL